MKKKSIKVGLPPNIIVPDLKKLASQETSESEYITLKNTKSKSESFRFYKHISPCFIKTNLKDKS